ncbi:uncharacterized protein LOC132726391 [Ruditapes philippinarum]|uniref:uncharacterized protein LOC132726391 n=1 Tax=Ruditapes philippinarum TaxID=129788 RepID=UPI00295B8487|nr:uncharacterized protein LOC132726391 [Ruditapes philippinarum]
MADSNLSSCEPCRYRGITSPAARFCKSCQEKLCKECVDCHKSFKITRDHVLVETPDQQSTKLSQDIEDLKMCKDHANKPTEFYCLTHESMLCSLCLLRSELHKKCMNRIVELESMGESFADSKLIDVAQCEFRSLIDRAHRFVTEIKEEKRATNENFDAVKSEGAALRIKFMKVFDKQIKKIVEKSTKIKEETNKRYSETIESLEDVISKAETNERVAKALLESGTPENIFRCLIAIIKQMDDFKLVATNLCEGDYSKDIIFMVKSDLMKQIEADEKCFIDFQTKSSKLEIYSKIPDRLLQGSLKSTFVKLLCTKTMSEHKVTNDGCDKAVNSIPDILGSDDVESEICSVKTTTKATKADEKKSICQVELPDVFDIKLKHNFTLDVTMPDNKTLWFNGIAFLPDGKVILSDSINSRLIFLNHENKVIMTKNLKYEPGHICFAGSNRLAICLMKTNQILLADTSKTPIRKEWYLQTKYHPKCIQFVHDKMLVSSQDASGEWYLNLMTVEGAVCRSIKYKRLLDGYILAIQSIPTETNNFRIIHYCKVANNLQCFGSDGSFVFDYGVDSVVAVVTDPNGYIYVIRYTGEIQILSPNGHFILRLYTGE